MIALYRNHWGAIRDKTNVRVIQTIKTVRWREWTSPDWCRILPTIFQEQTTAFKINASHSFVLHKKDGTDLNFFHASNNNFRVFDRPFFINTLQDFQAFTEAFLLSDPLNHAYYHRPDTQWSTHHIAATTFYIDKIQTHPIGCYTATMPQTISNNKHIYTLQRNAVTGQQYTDNLCFFRCLALHNGATLKSLSNPTTKVFNEWRQRTDRTQFEGVLMEELDRAEAVYKVGINVYRLEDPNSPSSPLLLIRHTQQQIDQPLALLLIDQHFCYITDIYKYSKSFKCEQCTKLFNTTFNLHRHQKFCKGLVTRYIYPGKVFHLQQTSRDILEQQGISLKDTTFPFRATWDIESYFNQDNVVQPKNAKSTIYLNTHIPASISVCSNVPGYEDAVCFVSDGDPQKLVSVFLDYLEEISKTSFHILKYRNREAIEKIERMIREIKQNERMGLFEEDEGNDNVSDTQDNPFKLKKILLDYLKELPVVSFNGGRYDINVIKSYFFTHWNSKTKTATTSASEQNNTPVEQCDSCNSGSTSDIYGPSCSKVPRYSNCDRNSNPAAAKNIRVVRSEQDHSVEFGDEEVEVDDNKGEKVGEIRYVIKRNNNYMCICTPTLKFLDIVNYLAPGVSYQQYLSAFGVEQEKGFFPYEWFTSLELLKTTSLPPIEAFKSELKGGRTITPEQYQSCQRAWEEHNMKCMRDYLMHYNSLDVKPFLEAIHKQSKFFKDKNIDMLKDGVSISGLTLRYLMSTIRPVNTFFSLCNEKNKDLLHLLKDQIVGGPSIVFHRYHEKDKTRIREVDYGDDSKLCRGILGLDSNSLYLACMGEEQPVNFPVRRKKENAFLPEQQNVYGQMACQWLTYVERTQNTAPIQHMFNLGEKRLGKRNLPVDGWDGVTQTAYQFQGCYFHGHGPNCPLLVGKARNDKLNKSFEELREKTVVNSDYLRKECKVNLIEMWECEWRELKKTDPVAKEIARDMTPTYSRLVGTGVDGSITLEDILNAVRDTSLFGLVQCDLEVPDNLKEKFSEVPPIFKNTLVGRDDLSPLMLDYSIKQNILQQPRRMLISSYFGKDILLTTPLLRWYLNHGLVVTDIKQLVHYQPSKCFEHFADEVSNARREGDTHPSKSILADIHKLIGNSSYGKTCTRVESHRDVVYKTDECTATKLLQDPKFRKLTELDGGGYEIELAKETVKFNLPVQIGFFVYQYAKLRMLEFIYDCLDYYIERTDYQLIETDTDSAYLALSAKQLEDVVRPEKRTEFFKEYPKWFPALACDEHTEDFIRCKLRGETWSGDRECCQARQTFDKRTRGLFKVEFTGDSMVALCSKTYICCNETTTKSSAKGLNKHLNTFTKDMFLHVLNTAESGIGQNRGFLPIGTKMLTYTQSRAGLSYFYAKRRVLDDGVSTAPLDL